MELVNEQLESGQAYTVTSVALTGHGSTGLPSTLCRALNFYMMQVDEASLAERQAQIIKYWPIGPLSRIKGETYVTNMII